MKYADLTHAIIGCAMEVHSHLGNGFREIIYQRALAHELRLRGLSFERELELPVCYKGERLGTQRVDFLIKDLICVETKAVSQLENADLTQALNYLEAYNREVGLLLNFGAPSLQYKRLLNKKFRPTP